MREMRMARRASSKRTALTGKLTSTAHLIVFENLMLDLIQLLYKKASGSHNGIMTVQDEGRAH